MFTQLYRSDHASATTPEMLMVATVLLAGLVVGFSVVRDTVVAEISDIGGSVQDVNQTFSFQGVTRTGSSTHGSSVDDRTDFCDSPEDEVGAADNCIVFNGAPSDEYFLSEPGLIGLTDGSKLVGGTQTFNWSANGTEGIVYWWLYVGSGQGRSDYYYSGWSRRLETTATVSGLPTDGSPIHVRVWFYKDRRWQYTDYEFTSCP